MFQPSFPSFRLLAGNSLDPQTALNNAAQQLATGGGSVGYTTLYNQLSSAYGAAVANQLLPTIQKSNPNFNVASSDAQAAATGSNVSTSGTAQTNAYNTVYSGATTAQANYDTARNGINTLGTNVLNTMANSPGINPSDSTFLNTQLNNVSTQFNSPAYANFNAQIAGLQRMVSSYLQAGEIPTSATAGATALVNGSLTVGSLASTLQGIDSDLAAASSAQGTLANYAKSQMSAGTSGSSTGNTTGTGGTGGTGTFSDSSFYGNQ